MYNTVQKMVHVGVFSHIHIEILLLILSLSTQIQVRSSCICACTTALSHSLSQPLGQSTWVATENYLSSFQGN